MIRQEATMTMKQQVPIDRWHRELVPEECYSDLEH